MFATPSFSKHPHRMIRPWYRWKEEIKFPMVIQKMVWTGLKRWLQVLQASIVCLQIVIYQMLFRRFIV
jgi:hypothetical protein